MVSIRHQVDGLSSIYTMQWFSMASRQELMDKGYDVGKEHSQAIIPVAQGSVGNSDGKAQNTHIDIFVRIKPVPKPTPRLQWEPTESKLEFNLPREAAAGYVNNQREHYEFRFNGIIGPEAKQDEVSLKVCSLSGTLHGTSRFPRRKAVHYQHPWHAETVPRQSAHMFIRVLTLQVFERVARNVVLGALQGFNGECASFMARCSSFLTSFTYW